MFAACHIIAAYLQQKLKLFLRTRYYSPGIRYKNLVLDTIRCIFVTVTLSSPLITLQLNGCHTCHDAKMTIC